MIHVLAELFDVDNDIAIQKDASFRALHQRYKSSVQHSGDVLRRVEAFDFPSAADRINMDAYYKEIDEIFRDGQRYIAQRKTQFFEDEEREERLLATCTRLSYILYTIGLISALMGKLYGVEAVDAE